MTADKWKHTALLVMDMQKDFIDEDGLVPLNGAKAIVPNVISAVEVARQRGILVTWEYVNLVSLDYPSVTVIADATAAATPEVHAANLFDMKNVGVATPTLQEWSDQFDA